MKSRELQQHIERISIEMGIVVHTELHPQSNGAAKLSIRHDASTPRERIVIFEARLTALLPRDPARGDQPTVSGWPACQDGHYGLVVFTGYAQGFVCEELLPQMIDALARDDVFAADAIRSAVAALEEFKAAAAKASKALTN